LRNALTDSMGPSTPDGLSGIDLRTGNRTFTQNPELKGHVIVGDAEIAELFGIFS
jgi:hypothetical protein